MGTGSFNFAPGLKWLNLWITMGYLNHAICTNYSLQAINFFSRHQMKRRIDLVVWNLSYNLRYFYSLLVPQAFWIFKLSDKFPFWAKLFPIKSNCQQLLQSIIPKIKLVWIDFQWQIYSNKTELTLQLLQCAVPLLGWEEAWTCKQGMSTQRQDDENRAAWRGLSRRLSQ